MGQQFIRQMMGAIVEQEPPDIAECGKYDEGSRHMEKCMQKSLGLSLHIRSPLGGRSYRWSFKPRLASQKGQG